MDSTRSTVDHRGLDERSGPSRRLRKTGELDLRKGALRGLLEPIGADTFVAGFEQRLQRGELAGIDIDSKLSQVRVHIDELSRVRDPSGLWSYYTDEDIADAILVFEGVTTLKM